MNESVCFMHENGSNSNDTWCITKLTLCGNTPAYDISFHIKEFKDARDKNCANQCLNQSTGSQVRNISEILIKCKGESNCSLADTSPPSTSHGGILTLTFYCNNTDVAADNITTKSTLLPTSSSMTSTLIPTTKNSTRTESSIFSTGNNTITTGTAQFSTGSSDSGTVPIVVSVVVVSIIVVVVVVAFLMYRRGQCKQLLGKCTKKYAKHFPDRTDTYAMSSEANANFTYDLSSDIDVSRSDVDYCEIDKVGQESGVEYNHVNLKKTPVAKEDPTYNHIGHLNSSPGNTEQTYNLVGDEMFQNTSLFTLQPDTYSHIDAMEKPASEQLAEDSYAHINGVKQYIPEVYDVNQYDCAVFQPNGGPTGHQERVMDSGKENMFNVVRPGTMDGNNEAPVSHSYFIVEKHEKEA